MGRFSNKVAVVTGGCSGIGLGAVERFVAEGAKVAVGDIDDTAGAALADRFQGQVVYVHCEVMDEAQIEGLLKAAASRFGGVDILFNNAGAGGPRERMEELTSDGWDFAQDLLLRSVALGIRHAVPLMKARGGGSIVNTASIAGTQAGFGPIAYSVAKAGVIHLTRVAAADLARDRIRVNAVCPGLILTNIFTANGDHTEDSARLVKQSMAQRAPESQPIAKAGHPADVAAAVLFLASEDSAFITGDHLMVDGGLFVGPRQSWDPELRAERAAGRAALQATS